mmetsp:Transcript_144352/g.251727  ORF Transcript_144352/g.251727 Transcript_144352/m.251727 type:complete len:237 (+) Transcript_144352:199-909(+)
MYTRQSPPPDTVSATRKMSLVAKSKIFVKSGGWFRKKPVRVMRPGPNETTATSEPFASRRRFSSRAKRTLHSFESLYALSASYAPPSTMTKSPLGWVSRPDRSPRVAPSPTDPPGDSGSCTSEAVTTTLPPLAASTWGRSRLASRKWPKWLVPTVTSKPSAVRSTSLAPEYWTPALSANTSSGMPKLWNSAAQARTEARDARSQAMGTRLSGDTEGSCWRMAAFARWAFSRVRHAR